MTEQAAGCRPEAGGKKPAQERRGLLGLAEIAERFGVSRQRIQQQEQLAIFKLRRAITREARAAGVSVREWLFGE